MNVILTSGDETLSGEESAGPKEKRPRYRRLSHTFPILYLTLSLSEIFNWHAGIPDFGAKKIAPLCQRKRRRTKMTRKPQSSQTAVLIKFILDFLYNSVINQIFWKSSFQVANRDFPASLRWDSPNWDPRDQPKGPPKSMGKV